MKRLILLRVSVLLIGFGFSSSVSALNIHYTVTMPNPSDHYLQVQMALSRVEGEMLEVQMPAWSPGRYQIRNFSRNVCDFAAVSSTGSLVFQKIDKQTWRIQTQKAAQLTIRYRVYANTLDGVYSKLDDRYAFLDGPSLYMYVVEHKADPVALTITPPSGWMILSSAGELGQTDFTFPNYDIMIDHLVQLGTFFVERFKIANTEYRVCIFNNGDRKAIPALVEKVKKLQQAAVTMLGPLDTERYTYFFHFVPDSPTTAGMEHLACCQLTRKHDLVETGDAMDLTIWVTAHELIHAWNIKRLRPQGLGPWDYTREVYTPLLWLGEGCTSYLADLILLRSGVWNKQKFYNRIAENMRDFYTTPGRLRRSPEQTSWDTWLWAKEGFGEADWENVWISYYLTGEILGMCLDLEIRHRTQNKKCFEDFFHCLYQRCYSQAEPESYYLKGRGYTQEDILSALETTTGDSWQEFYQNHIASPGDIDFSQYLAYAALTIKIQDEKPPLPYTGLRLGAAPGGYPLISWIEAQSPAESAKLSIHDILLALNGERVLSNDFNEVLRRHAADSEIKVTLLREDRLLEKTLHLDKERKVVTYQIQEEKKSPTPAKRIRQDWLKEKTKSLPPLPSRKSKGQSRS